MRIAKQTKQTRPSMRCAAVAALTLVAVSGCEFVSFTSNSPGGGGAPDRARAAPNDGSPNHPEEMAKRYKIEFEKFGGCTDHCGAALLERADISGTYAYGQVGQYVDMEPRGESWRFNPVEWMDNPDPAWLTGWDQMIADDLFATKVTQAVALAANRRKWRAHCDARFDESWAKHAAREKAFNSKLALALEDADADQRIRKLLDLRDELDAYEKLPTLRSVGVTYEVEHAVAEQVRAAKADGAFYGVRRNRGSRYWSGRSPRAVYNEAEERTLACGNQKSQPSVEHSDSARYVEDVVDREKLAALNKRVRADNEAAIKAATVIDPKAVGDQHSFVIAKNLETSAEGDAVVLRFSEVVDAKVRRCRETKDKVMKVQKNGDVRIENDTACWHKPIKRTIQSEVKLPASILPAELVLQPGDKLVIFGTKDPGKERDTERRHSLSYDVDHIRSIARGETSLLKRW